VIDLVIVFQALRADFLESRGTLSMASSCLYREKHSHVKYFKSSREPGEISLWMFGGFNFCRFFSEPGANSREVLLCRFF